MQGLVGPGPHQEVPSSWVGCEGLWTSSSPSKGAGTAMCGIASVSSQLTCTLPLQGALSNIAQGLKLAGIEPCPLYVRQHYDSPTTTTTTTSVLSLSLITRPSFQRWCLGAVPKLEPVSKTAAHRAPKLCTMQRSP
jgi:hypothetical protein